GLEKSVALGGGTLPRNSPGLSHAAFQTAQFWDLRARTLEEQIHHVIHGEREFGTHFLPVLTRLRAHPDYPALFRAAFGEATEDGGPVNVGAMNKAIAQYVRSL